MIALESSLQKNPEMYKNIHKALLKAYDLFEHDHETSIKDIQKYLELSEEVLETDAYGRYTPNPEINREACVEFWNNMNTIGYIESDEDINNYLYEDLYDQAVAEMVEENPDNDFYKEVQKGGYGSKAQ